MQTSHIFHFKKILIEKTWFSCCHGKEIFYIYTLNPPLDMKLLVLTFYHIETLYLQLTWDFHYLHVCHFSIQLPTYLLATIYLTFRFPQNWTFNVTSESELPPNLLTIYLICWFHTIDYCAVSSNRFHLPKVNFCCCPVLHDVPNKYSPESPAHIFFW